MKLKSLKSRNLHARVQESLRDFFISSRMKAGDLIPTEAALAKGLGVSRTAIREGLRGLEALGILEAKSGVGRFLRDFNLEALWDSLYYNLEMTLQDFNEVVDVRVTLESAYLERNLPQFTREDIHDLERIVQKMEDSVNTHEEPDWIKDHTEFHLRLHRRSNNSVLLSLIRIFSTMQHKLVIMQQYKTEDRRQFIDHHRQLLRAIETKDSEAVRRRLLEHFSEVLKWKDKSTEIGTSPDGGRWVG